jgi:formate/nitrite transporter
MANYAAKSPTGTGVAAYPDQKPVVTVPEEISDSVKPPDMMSGTAEAAVAKTQYSALGLLVKGFLCTGFLGYATAFAFLAVSQGMPQFLSGILFPVGYVMVAILGLEMATGSFSVMPIGMLAGKVTGGQLARNWVLTLLGNLMGGIFFGAILWIVFTNFGNTPVGTDGNNQSVLAAQIVRVAEHKVFYSQFGALGLLIAFVSGILCNWLVSLGPIMALASRSTIGKVVLLWLPFATFFALGFEHAIVNMFLLPTGIMFGANYTIADWWIWNQIPVTLGNITAGVIINGVLMWTAHNSSAAKLAH